ncbi:MAG: APC family permease, partial [Myxococcota bacterium]
PLETSPAPPADTGFAAFAQAYMPVYFAFSGWNAALYVGAEIDDPKRNLARALIWGTAIVAGVYLLLCAAFLKVFGLVGLRNVYEAGTATAIALFGSAGATGMTVLLLLAMLGTLNGTILIGSRIAVVMAARGEAPAIATTLNVRRTPVVALWLQTALSVLLISFGQHVETLLNYTTSAMLLTGSLVVLSMLALRRRGIADGTWTYRVKAFPLAPALYVGSSVAVLVFVLAERGIREGVVALWFVACLLGHRLFLQRRQARAAEPDTLSG